FIIIFPEGLDGIYRKQGCVNILPLWMDVLFMMFQDMVYNRLDPFFIVVQLCDINIVASAVVRVIQLVWIDAVFLYLTGKNCPLVLYREPQNIPVCNGIFYHITMQAGIQFPARMEYIGGCTSV